MNHLHLIGFLGKDPEVRFTNNGQKVTSFSIACGKDDNLFWIKCAAFGETHDKMISYLKKGSLISVCGDLKKPRTYVDKSGNTQVSIEMTISSISFVPSKNTEKTTNTEVVLKDDLPF